MPTPRSIPPAFLGAAYVGLTIAGLYIFRGIPVLNVALGFPIGAWVASRLEPRSAADGSSSPGAVGAETLRALLGWAIGLAAVTVVAGWIELASVVVSMRFPGSLGSIARWLPLKSHSTPTYFRTMSFAIASAPALQVLTTVFGGILALSISREHDN